MNRRATPTSPPPRLRLRAPRARARTRAFSLIECIIAIGILSIMYAAALNAVGSSRLGQQKIAINRRAHELAQDLLAEVLQQPYWDPTAASGMGPEPGESAVANRTQFDDVDDYRGYTEAAPIRRDGAASDAGAGWSRAVAVAWVDPNNLTTDAASETGVKRITVTVSHNTHPIASITGLRANID